MPKFFTATAVLALLSAVIASGQAPVSVGSGSYAAFPPTYKAKTDAHGGFNATAVEGKKLYVDEQAGRPLPTNDWWTDVINSRYSGALWSLPQMLYTGEAGVTVHYPTYWNENGTEVKPSSSIRVGGKSFAADATIATDWGDWHVVMRMPSADNRSEMKVTMAHGMPFTWFELEGMAPVLSFSETPRFFDKNGQSGSRPRGNVLGVVLGHDLYGIYMPEGTVTGWSDGRMTLSDATPWIVVALLNTPADLEEFEAYATSVPRSTTLTWNYEQSRALINTSWNVKAENLVRRGADAPVLQGFLPHAYKNTDRKFAFDGHEYLTPRGRMRIARSGDAGTSHTFSYAYRFEGILPYYAAPRENNAATNPYDPSRMKALIDNYAANGTFGADTYWGGKGLVQMALNMTFAKETGNTEAYETSRKKLREKLIDWLTYTPGENQFFFAHYPRWGALTGFDCSYDSDAFNDHHFHYGYFIYSGALLCLEDADFRANYGPMLRELALDYANYDRSVTRYPFLRTLDPWAGHSYAGGLGDAGNDNGNGQESSSEAMQSWGALYLLGVALGDNEMRDAGIFGYMTESNGVAEYWFDRDQIHPEREHNYDYTKYTSPYCTNLTAKGIGWWTWFSGDALWMHSIQWMPVSPCLNYLSKDLEFVKWDFEKMMASTNYKWLEDTSEGDALAKQSVGNVVLCYMERYDPDGAAAIFDQAYDGGFGMARNTDTGHISYYAIQSHRTYGDLDFGVYADCPTANAYRRADGTMTYMVYNPGQTDLTVNFYRDGALEKTVKAAPGMTPFCDAATASKIAVSPSESPVYAAPGTTTSFSAKVLDQYGAEFGGDIAWSLPAGAPANIDADGRLTVNANAAKGTEFLLTATSGILKTTVTVNVNDRPAAASAKLTGAPKYSETGHEIAMTLEVTDQYGRQMDAADAEWKVSRGGTTVATSGTFTPAQPGIHTVTATIGGKTATATINVTPPLNNIALKGTAIGSSEENAGTLVAGVNDGDTSTRWGSKHNDGEWIMIDLGEDAFISRVEPNWEAAFASNYEIQIAPATARTGTFIAGYVGGDKPVTVPLETEWTTVITESTSTTGIRSTAVGATGRYVRIKSLKRATNYGVSLLELGIYGIPVSTPADAVIGLALTAPVQMDQNSTATLSAKAYTLDGRLTDTSATWSADNAATFTGNSFTPLGYGNYTLTAKTSDGTTATAAVMVNETAQLSRFAITPATTQVLAGESRTFEIEAVDQFGAIVNLPAGALSAKVTRADGQPAQATFDVRTLTFRSDVPGDYTVSINDGLGTATVAVRDIAEANLALGHAASASSTAGGNTASFATDGLTDPAQGRYESEQADGQWLTVDLDDVYLINRMRILWEGAYAKAYRVQTSLDGANWSTALTVTDGKGGTTDDSFADTPARFVRLALDRRATAYGFSLYELEVYGKARLDLSDSGEAPEITSFDVTTANGTATLTGAATHEQGYVNLRFDVSYLSTGRVVGSENVAAASGSATIGGLYSGIDYRARLTATDLFGNAATAYRDFKGEYSIEGMNLALGKPAGAGSQENGATPASYVTDGDTSTRWASDKSSDLDWVKIDLGQIYPVEQIDVMWETARAKSYDIMLAAEDPEGLDNDLADDSQYTAVATVSDVKANEFIATRLDETRMARYVMIRCHDRMADGWGFSIFEVRVFGNNDLFTPVIDDTDPSQEELDDWSKMDDWNEWTLPGEPETPGTITIVPETVVADTGRVNVYTLSGTIVRRNVKREEATRHLLPGFYIVGREKVRVD